MALRRPCLESLPLSVRMAARRGQLVPQVLRMAIRNSGNMMEYDGIWESEYDGI